MKRIIPFAFFLNLCLSVQGEGRSEFPIRTEQAASDATYWNKMADGMTQALIKHFWGANFEGYPKRYYFNYESDLANMTTNHYWPQAHAMDVIVDAYMRTSEKQYLDLYPLWWKGAPEYNFSGKEIDPWWNEFVDDMEWMALAQLRMYETTQHEEYFLKAKQIYNDWIWPTWGPEKEEPWKGGITWKTDVNKSKNACSNGPAAIIAARIYTMYDQIVDPGKKPKRAYLNQAIKIYSWLRDHLFVDSVGKVCDNMNGRGRIDPAVYTYNQGTFIGAAHELYKITGTKQYLSEAVKAANYVIDSMSDNNGVLSNATSGDGGLFHGIFFRYFVKLINEPDLDDANRKKFHDYITHCATVMAENGVNQESMLYGGNWWEAPASTKGVGLTPHLSGCMLMEAMCTLKPLPVAQSHYTTTQSDTWVATDALGRRTGESEYPTKRGNKTVGIFYFIWMGAHGYDRHTDTPGGAIPKPTASDVNSPYDISEMLRENPDNPQYGPEHAFHYWAKPHFDYYVSNDEWVIEKHIQMIADAGIDVMVLDNTNAQIYLPQWLAICKVMTRMRAQGRTTPLLASMINSNSVRTLQNLYDNFYAKGLYKELWFYWKGKPLVLCPMEGISQECRDFFSIRHAWFDSRQPWFDGSKDKWTWGDYYPQGYGWHEAPDKVEQVSVSAATHPTSNIGRSYHDGKQPPLADFKSGEGAFFAEQWKRVFELDPEFVFITGWNEWVAMRFTNGAAGQMLGKPIKKGDTYFVDQYNEEFSRDIEPMRGGFGDNYYYQMVDLIRQYKGVGMSTSASGFHQIKIDGDTQDWDEVQPTYTDDRGDITPRNHFGWGKVGQLTNNTGRNDIVKSKVATDGKTLFFYMEADESIRLDKEAPLQLLLTVNHNPNGWEGFQYRVNITTAETALSSSTQNSWNRQSNTTVTSKIQGKHIELAIPLKQLDINDSNNFTVDFKWADNMPQSGDIKDFMDNGDTAPNARFKYRFQLKSAK